MSINTAIHNALGRANAASAQLASYNYNFDPRSEPNGQIRNNARLTIDPAVGNLQYAANNSIFASPFKVNQTLQAAELLREATFDLSDHPRENPGQAANVPLAQSHIQQAIGLLLNVS